MITCSDYYPEYNEGGREVQKGSMVCQACSGRNLKFSWKRNFNLAAHGWFGWHEYWKCMDCRGGWFNCVTGSYLGSIDDKVRCGL